MSSNAARRSLSAFETHRQYTDNLFDLLKAYAERRQKLVAIAATASRSSPSGRSTRRASSCRGFVGAMDDWGRFDVYLRDYLQEPGQRRSLIASSFSASLELAREGTLEIRQEQAFKPIYMRRRPAAAAS